MSRDLVLDRGRWLAGIDANADPLETWYRMLAHLEQRFGGFGWPILFRLEVRDYAVVDASDFGFLGYDITGPEWFDQVVVAEHVDDHVGFALDQAAGHLLLDGDRYVVDAFFFGCGIRGNAGVVIGEVAVVDPPLNVEVGPIEQ